MWVDDFSSDLGLYAARCDYLQPGWLDMRQRVIDIGLLGENYFFFVSVMLYFEVVDPEPKIIPDPSPGKVPDPQCCYI